MVFEQNCTDERKNEMEHTFIYEMAPEGGEKVMQIVNEK